MLGVLYCQPNDLLNWIISRKEQGDGFEMTGKCLSKAMEMLSIHWGFLGNIWNWVYNALLGKVGQHAVLDKKLQF